jgi:FlaA1/EpsC-like NDP-sugar epimerase
MTHSTVDQTWTSFPGRPIPQRDDASTRTVHAGRSVLLTGAAESIGSVLARASAQYSKRCLILLGRSMRRLDSLTRNIRADSPHVCVISVVDDLVAAQRDVQRMVPEFNPCGALMALLDSHHPRLVRA